MTFHIKALVQVSKKDLELSYDMDTAVLHSTAYNRRDLLLFSELTLGCESVSFH